MIPNDKVDWSNEEWRKYWKRVLKWLVKVWKSCPNLPDEALPLLFRLFNLLDELNDLIDKGDFVEAIQISVIIDDKLICLWHILERSKQT